MVVGFMSSSSVGLRVLWGGFILGVCILLSACEKKPAEEKGATHDLSEIIVESAVMPALPPGQTTAAIYLSMRNNTDKTVVINHIYSSLSDHIEVHRTLYEEGMMKMRPVAHVSISPGDTMRFTPSGYHLMVFNISSPVMDGDTFSLTVEFEGGRTVTSNVDVRSLAL